MIANTTTKLEEIAFQIPQGQSSNFKLQLVLLNAYCFKSHRDKVQISPHSYCVVWYGSFQIPQGQSSNKDKFQDIEGGIEEFQIPQGQSSNEEKKVATATMYSFKSHRDKVQI